MKEDENKNHMWTLFSIKRSKKNKMQKHLLF